MRIIGGVIALFIGVVMLGGAYALEYAAPLAWWIGSLFFICLGLWLLLFGGDQNE